MGNTFQSWDNHGNNGIRMVSHGEDGGFHQLEVPQNGWFIITENPKIKWMI